MYTWVRGYVDEYVGTWIRDGYVVGYVPGFMSTRIRGYVDVIVCLCLSLYMSYKIPIVRRIHSHILAACFCVCSGRTSLYSLITWCVFLVCYVVFMLTSSGWALRRLGTMQVSTFRIEDVLFLSLSHSLCFALFLSMVLPCY